MKTGGTIQTTPSRSQSSDQGRNRSPRRRAGLMAKMNGRLALSAVAAMAALSLTRPAHGQVTGTWINRNGGSWGDLTNWQGGFVPGADTDIADFSTLDLTKDATVTLDAQRTVGGLVFGDTNPSNNWLVN